MKILHLSSEKTWRGGEQQIAYLVEEQISSGEDVMVLCRRNSVFEKYCLDNEIPFESLGFVNNFDLATAKGLKNLQKKLHFDIIHIHSSRSHSIAIIATKLGLKGNLILSRRVDFPSSGNFLSNYKYNHPQIKRVICVSEKVKQIIGETITDKSKLAVVYDGIDLKRFEGNQNNHLLHHEYGLSDETLIVANISALADHKDYPTFVETAKIFKEKYQLPVKFFIIGEGELKIDIENYIKKVGISNSIIMTGFRKDIRDIFREIDVFLMTSKEEGLGSTNLDAFANQVPVVATSGGGIPEVILHKETGLLAPIKSPDILADYVYQLLTDKGLREKVTTIATTSLHQRFTKEVMAKQTMILYQEVIRETNY
ncbi:MAG: glycosyltransferase family 4 protein [Flavobacteriales bacterium]|nr:glycosyltransferase family 4 protein [Flavobacteriales bacterium]